jgi:hypothetical protein
MLRSDTTAVRATTTDHRQDALAVLADTYADEKQWVREATDMFPVVDLDDDRIMWIVATVDGHAAGVLRVHYDPPLHLYREYGLQALDDAPEIDVDAFLHEHRIAEIGRFAVRPAYRRRLRVVFEIMRVAAVDTLQRDYTHYVTDVFEGEAHSPYRFHTRVLGFKPVAVHATGEMNCLHRRITLLLNLKEAYQRLRDSKNRLYDRISEGLSEQRRKQLAT